MNRKNVWVAFIVFSLSVTSWAIDFMGPPRATLSEKQFKLGFTYHYSENDLLVDDAGLNNVDVSRYYAILGYGISNRFEVYSMLGIADVGQSDIGFSSNLDFAYGVGAKLTAYEGEKIDWGLIAQMSWFQVDEDASVSRRFGNYVFTGSGSVDLDAYELQIALGPTFKMDGWQFYGGAFYYMLDGDLDAKGSLSRNGVPVASGRVSADLEEDSNVGGFVGMLFHLAENLDAIAEVAATGDAWGAGINLTWTF